MKRFHELNKEEQELATQASFKELSECIHSGIIHFETVPTREQLNDIAEAAAEDAFYPEFGDRVLYNIVDKK